MKTFFAKFCECVLRGHGVQILLNTVYKRFWLDEEWRLTTFLHVGPIL